MSAALDGPRIPAAAGRTSQLVVFLHGYGADGNDLIELGRQWRSLCRRPPSSRPMRPIALRARRWAGNGFRSPQPVAGRSRRRRGTLDGRGQGARRDRRFSRRRAPAARPRRFEARASRLQPGVHDGAACRPPPPASARSDPWLFRAVGRTRASQRSDGARCARRAPPVLLIHGDQDPMIPFDAMFMAAEALAGAVNPHAMASVVGNRPRHRRRGLAAGRALPRQGVRKPKALGGPASGRTQLAPSIWVFLAHHGLATKATFTGLGFLIFCQNLDFSKGYATKAAESFSRALLLASAARQGRLRSRLCERQASSRGNV